MTLSPFVLVDLSKSYIYTPVAGFGNNPAEILAAADDWVLDPEMRCYIIERHLAPLLGIYQLLPDGPEDAPDLVDCHELPDTFRCFDATYGLTHRLKIEVIARREDYAYGHCNYSDDLPEDAPEDAEDQIWPYCSESDEAWAHTWVKQPENRDESTEDRQQPTAVPPVLTLITQ